MADRNTTKIIGQVIEMLAFLINQYWGETKPMMSTLNRDEKTRVTRTIGRVKQALDNYLPERTDTLKIACDVCSVILNDLTEERKIKEINMADYGFLDSAADRREV